MRRDASNLILSIFTKVAISTGLVVVRAVRFETIIGTNSRAGIAINHGRIRLISQNSHTLTNRSPPRKLLFQMTLSTIALSGLSHSRKRQESTEEATTSVCVLWELIQMAKCRGQTAQQDPFGMFPVGVTAIRCFEVTPRRQRFDCGLEPLLPDRKRDQIPGRSKGRCSSTIHPTHRMSALFVSRLFGSSSDSNSGENRTGIVFRENRLKNEANETSIRVSYNEIRSLAGASSLKDEFETTCIERLKRMSLCERLVRLFALFTTFVLILHNSLDPGAPPFLQGIASPLLHPTRSAIRHTL